MSARSFKPPSSRVSRDGLNQPVVQSRRHVVAHDVDRLSRERVGDGPAVPLQNGRGRDSGDACEPDLAGVGTSVELLTQDLLNAIAGIDQLIHGGRAFELDASLFP